MTSDEQREVCIAAIITCMGWEDSPGKRLAAGRVLDSLHGIASVLTFETLEEMAETDNYEDFMSVAAAGDLTNPPQKETKK